LGVVAVAADFGGSSFTRTVLLLGGEGLCADDNDLVILISTSSIMIWHVLSHIRGALDDSGLCYRVGNSVPRQDSG